MKKSEKIITAVLTMVFGILLIAMQDKFIGILMTIGGVSLLVLGAVDIFQRFIPPAVIKIVSGILIIVCGWVLVEAVLYVIAALLLIAGVLLLYDKIRKRVQCDTLWRTVLEYALPAVCILIGAFLLFHQAFAIEIIFIISGSLTLIEGGLLLVEAFDEE
ncbi:MAG: DUF308 domain-containing protein [Clostridia bacterium]|nr:DUF308 domain-containing protein [Clostridia bacterium]